MPQIYPLTLFCPAASQLDQSKANSVEGPKIFVDLLERAENHHEIQAGIKILIKSKHYQSLSQGHFWYRIETKQGSFEGVITGVLAASKNQNITTHEAILEQRVQMFTDYLTVVGFQAEPVLLMHENNLEAAALGKHISSRKEDLLYHLGSERHQLWALNPKEVSRLSNFCEQQDQFHLADGHHRYASTINTAKEGLNPPLLFSFLVAKDQVKNAAYTWAIKDIQLAEQLLKNLPPESVCDKTVANIEITTKDFHIYCQAKRSLTLSSYIVEKLLGGTAQHKIDLKSLIAYYPPGELSTEKAKAYPAITNYKPLSLDKIITLAKAQKILPPKSTFILPKLPTGLCLTPLAKGQIK